MLTEYEHYAMSDRVVDSVCSSSGSSGSQVESTSSSFMYATPTEGHATSMALGWQPEPPPVEDAYTLTVLSDTGAQPAGPPPPPPYVQDPWGMEAWQQHGPAHAGNPFEDDTVSGSDGSSPDRRCVRSLLHVALAKGSSFAQQFTGCGVPPPPCYPGIVKQEPGSPGMFVSSTSCGPSCGSPRPVTPADSMRSCYSPASSSPYALLMPPCGPCAPHHCDDAVVSTTSSYSMSMDVPAPGSLGAFSPAPPPSYPLFRTPYPTPSPDPCYPPRPEPFPSPLLPLPVHLLSSAPSPTSPSLPPTPTSRSGGAKRRRNRKAPVDANGTPAPRKRERSERQLHPCTLCDKRFKDNYSVNVHMRTHTGEKPFPCIVCGKMFRQKAHLAKHRSTHQPDEWAAAAALAANHLQSSTRTSMSSLGEHVSVDSNSNSLPLWAESKCKATNVWTPSVVSPQLSSVQ